MSEQATEVALIQWVTSLARIYALTDMRQVNTFPLGSRVDSLGDLGDGVALATIMGSLGIVPI